MHSQVDAVVVGDEVDCQAQVPEAAAAAHAVQVGLAVLGEVKVDDHVHALDVDAAREQVCAAAAEDTGVQEAKSAVTTGR